MEPKTSHIINGSLINLQLARKSQWNYINFPTWFIIIL